jgi:hypothetical protein
MYSTKQREYYNHDRDLVCKALGITKNQYNWFRRIGQDLHKVYENDCNGLYQEENEAEHEANRYYGPCDRKVKELGLFIYYQTDPRGVTIYLNTEPMTQSNYNQGHCIY